MNKSQEYSERFLDPSDRGKAVCDLADLKEQAIPILEQIFNGSSVNKFGVPYNKLGMPVSCSLAVVERLGPSAKSLKKYVKQQVEQGHAYAQDALYAIEHIENT